ncbi:type II secretion system protein GspM [Profundibacterium mesophilum]|uniref:Type II secretion system protein M n=1 Tax=Profundibacterium mesophilum KAUST100406-0324 TaxID=1037889 RepID=A0A921NUP5_9RHOB|nr:type II secretion system protein GspM [Profundibacterium mesophilum]KAF0675835.1 Type II secretion system protein M [Profundibacterium mesophilum KAUST100406-0324]
MGALSRLTARERLLLAAGAAALALFAAVQMVWLPLQERAAVHRGEIAAYLELTAAARDAAARPARPAPPPPLEPAASRVTRSAEAAGLTLTRLEPQAAGVTVLLAEARFAPLVDWLAALEAEDGLKVTAAEIDRRLEPGSVSARITLEGVR